MPADHDFLQRVQYLGERLEQLEALADPAARAAAKEVVQLVMELHGTALERMLEIIFESGKDGTGLIDELGQDGLVSNLLVLHGLHPEEISVRVERKMRELRPRLFKMGAEVREVAVTGGEVRVRLEMQGHTCGSTAQSVRAMVEEAVYEAAPDVTRLRVEGLDAPVAAGFVTMKALVGATAPARAVAADLPRNSEGMD